MKKFISGFLGILFTVAMIVFAGILQYFNLLVFWQRVTLLLLFLILGIMAYHGIKHRSLITSFISTLILALVISFSSVAAYSILSLYSTLGRMNTPKSGEQVKINEKEVDEHIEEGFHIYISGIDTWGPIAQESRSDVNLIVSVNPKSGQSLITTVPRDSYVKIADGGHDQYDKLTHAGNYGIFSSIHTLENLFNIKIPYYVRVNFDSLIKMIDSLNGITIENPRRFKAEGVTFPKGRIQLNGKEALIYARDRKHMEDGELQRGRNHVMLLQAIIKKCLSPAILVKANDLMSIMADNMQTNMPPVLLTRLINKQLSSGTNWQFDSAQVKGTPRQDLKSYAMPHRHLYMYKLDETSVSEIAGRMKAVTGTENPYR